MAAATQAHLTPSERAARGQAARKLAPRSSHGDWEPSPTRPDPIALLEEQAKTRVPALVPIRYGRMLVSPFAFFRGTASIMAADLASTPGSGYRAQLCGDAHLSNFGIFGTPERRFVFDINDFDETHPGPWEWDVKRLAASFAVAGRDCGFSRKQRARIVASTVRSYRETMRELAVSPSLMIWYSHLEIDPLLARLRRKLSTKRLARVEKDVAKARTKDSMRAFSKLTGVVDGERKIVSDPPLIVSIEELLDEAGVQLLDGDIRTMVNKYRRTLTHDRRDLLDQYRLVHIARKVVGVGSVGTRAWIVLFLGRDEDDPLMLQVKQAEASVLEPYLGASEYKNSGQRVVVGQRRMQAAGDPFLGWTHVKGGAEGAGERDYYVRQLWDWKGSATIEAMIPSALARYGRVCASTLARAHARSGDRIGIAGYLGRGSVFDQAMVSFAETYADQNERDYAALAEAVETGRVEAQTGL
ncbi:MAG TPA: DUF2252 domain-containing protein [Gaiellaceae bacterium]|nr:DUF2252 domain-containing protein [Gaiellaceae bacterium]